MPERSDAMLIVIPAWNEEAVLEAVLHEVGEVLGGGADVLVVSDGSTDSTAQIARRAGVMVLDLPLNLGVGGAMRAGYLYAQRRGYDWVVQLDADGQHDPREIKDLRARARETGADLVIGARFAARGTTRCTAPGSGP